MTVTVVQDNAMKFLKAIAELTQKEALVGIPSGSARSDASGMDNARLGFIHEFGSPARNIPARPFLVPGVKSAKAQIEAVLKAGAVKAVKGDLNAAERALHGAGLVAQSAVKKYITDSGNFVPLAPSTIEDRQRRGIDSDKPLIVTSSLLNSVTYVVRER